MPAAEDLERICERIERDDPEAARRAARTIYDGSARLRDFPQLGKATNRMPGRRDLPRRAGLAVTVRYKPTCPGVG